MKWAKNTMFRFTRKGLVFGSTQAVINYDHAMRFSVHFKATSILSKTSKTTVNGAKYSRVDQVKLVEDNL